MALLLTGVIYAQRYNYINYTVEDGLAQSQVRDICQDENGYLWIGTNAGLSRFDGIEFVNYSEDDGLPANAISKLFAAKNRDLWISTSLGAAKYKNGEIIPYYFQQEYRVNDIAELDGEIYFASNTGLLRINGDEVIPLGNEADHELYIRAISDYKDSILICGTNQGLYSWDGHKFDNFEVPNYPDLNIRNIELFEQKLYISARGIGLMTFDMVSGKTESINLNHTTVSFFSVDEDGIFGITTNSGAFLINESDTNYFNETNGLMRSGLECTFKDREGNIWLGTDGNGLMKFLGVSVVSYLAIEGQASNEGLASNLILSIQQDTNDNFMFGTYDRGITQFRGDTILTIASRGGLIVDNTVWTIVRDDLNRMWIGTSQGLSILDENNQIVHHAMEGSDRKIRTIVWRDSSTVLFGGDGLVMMEGDEVRILDSILNINKILVLDRKVYCATATGLFVFDAYGDYSTSRQIDLPEMRINTIGADFQHNVWVGTENGLFVILNNGKIWRFPLEDQNYRSKQILGIIESEDRSLWVSTMSGVYQIDFGESEEDKFRVFNYGASEGFITEESNLNAIYEDFQHRIWIGTARGLVRIDPELTGQLFNYKLPLLHISGLRLFLEEFDYADYKVTLDPNFNAPTFIELPYNKNHLTFDFIGINLKDPESVRYEYKLIGVDEEWAPITKSNYATYSFLQPGEYTFQVRAMNKIRNWSVIDEMQIVITPPFWKTWWFIALIVIAIFLIITAIFRSRIKVLKQQQDNEKLELKNRLLFLEQRSLNASMNRHFIFNSLNSIQYFINSSDKLSANRFLSNFAKLIRKNLDSSATNNFIVSLQEEIDRIQLYLSLEKMRFSDKFDYRIDVSSSIDTESIEIPSMILQPFVENSIIHGVLSLDRMGDICIHVYQEFGEIVFEVTDNGIGIDNSLKLKGNQPVGDHESKGVEITNRRIEILRRLTGENLLIVGPFQLNDENGNALGTKVILKLGGIEKFGE